MAQPPGTLFLPTSTTLLTLVHSENDSRVYFMIVLTTDYCWRSWTCRIAAPYKFHVDWSIEGKGKRNVAVRKTTRRYGNSHAICDYTVLPATRQSWHFRPYLSRSWYSIAQQIGFTLHLRERSLRRSCLSARAFQRPQSRPHSMSTSRYRARAESDAYQASDTYLMLTRSTQPCIPPGSLDRVPASAGVSAGMSPLPGGR